MSLPTTDNDAMSREQTIDALNHAFTQKYYSMAEYIREAKPYVQPGQESWLREIEVAAAADRAVIDRIVEAIQALDGIPQLDTYNPDVANLNYLSLDYLLGVLIRAYEEQLAHYEKSLALADSLAPAREIFQALCALTKDQLQRLRALK